MDLACIWGSDSLIDREVSSSRSLFGWGFYETKTDIALRRSFTIRSSHTMYGGFYSFLRECLCVILCHYL